MKIYSLFLFSCLFLFRINLLNSQNKNLVSECKQSNSSSVIFTENKGQVYDQNYKPRPDVLYGIMVGKMAVHIKNTGVSYQLFEKDKYNDIANLKTKEGIKHVDRQTIYRIDLNWLNANNNFIITQDEALPGYSSYYLESCPDGVLNVKSYKGITLRNLYEGIDLHYYEKNGNLKHDYIVAPQADYKRIRIEVKGADVNVNPDGSLLLNTPLGKVQEGSPIVYQNGKQLKTNWQIEKSILSFDIENYNPNYELIIDPVTRLWGTYYGGTGLESFQSCVADTLGNIYAAGYTNLNSGTIIATTGSHQLIYGGGTSDAFLAKFNSSGIRLWSTYYGASNEDAAYSCCTDVSGSIYLTGHTTGSSTVIATLGSHQPALGGNYDAFLVKFNNSGMRIWATYYGGVGDEFGNSCSTDILGNVYIAGYTNSNTGTSIATALAHQTILGGGKDAFLVKFNSSGIRQWGTYYGGIDYEYGNSCQVDFLGNIYLAGYLEKVSGTNTAIATLGSHQQIYGGGLRDAFLVKFNSAGIRQWGTYYGGNNSDYGYSCSVDGKNNVYLSGNTESVGGTVIASIGSHQTNYAGGPFGDAYLVKFNGNGVRQWGTYYGGTDSDYGVSCTADSSGNIYMAGHTGSPSGIATLGNHQPVYGGGLTNAYLVKFNSNGIRQWGTYYGGAYNDLAYSCVKDGFGNVYLAGRTTTSLSMIIATLNSHQLTFGGNWDGFLVKFKDCPLLNPKASAGTIVCQGSTINFSASTTGGFNSVYSWTGPNSFTSSLQNPSIALAGNIHAGVYTLTANYDICVETTTLLINVTDCNNTIEKDLGTEIKIYPNPHTNLFYIELPENCHLVIVNEFGSTLLSKEILGGKNTMDMSSFSNGVYFVKVSSQNKTYTKKIIVNK